MSIYDIFGMLLAGASIVLPDADKVKEPVHWIDLVEKHHVTLWNSVPAITEMALEMGNAKVLNVIMLGVYVGYTEVVSPEVVWGTIEHKLAKKAKLLPLNKEAFEKGLEIGRSQR